MSLHVQAAITAAILAIYLGGIAYAILSPAKQPDPQRGQAVGCLMFAAIPGVVVALLVAIGLIWNIPTLVRWPFAICVTIFLYVLVVLIAQPIMRGWPSRRRD